MDESSALWEQYAVQFFSTENITFYISNRDWTRMEKVKRIAELPEAHDNLQVCLVQSNNCGTCMKCKRTLMNLDVLGEDTLNKFANSFDLRSYKEKNRQNFFSTLWTDSNKDDYARDILQAAIDNNSELIENIPIQGAHHKYTYRYRKSRISVMSHPTYMSKEIALLTNDITDDDLVIVGKYGTDWIKVWLSDGRTGYIHSGNIKIQKYYPASKMQLNAGNHITLIIGAKYGLAPRFLPKNGNEQVNYFTDNNQVAFVNKTGWIYAISEGTAIITAKSESGLVDKCQVTVRAEIPKAGKIAKTPQNKSRLNKIAQKIPKRIRKKLKKVLNKFHGKN